MRYILVICLLGLCGCVTTATEYGGYEKRTGFRWFGVLSKYERVPKKYVRGGAGSIEETEKPDGTKIMKASRTGSGAIIDTGNILNVVKPTTEIK